jgi:hypothetical protein
MYLGAEYCYSAKFRGIINDAGVLPKNFGGRIFLIEFVSNAFQLKYEGALCQ